MILDSFRNTIKSYRMLEHTKRIYVACSGGPDSVTLLHLLLKIQKERKFQIGILHANHQLRGVESDQDQEFVQRLAKKFSLPLIAESLHVKEFSKENKLSVEEAARILRYEFFLRAARERSIDTIALGHTMDDQAETILMRVLTGSGLVGLGGVRSAFKRGNVRFVRPVSQISKQELLDYLKRNEILYRTDASNLSDRFLRNQIRLHVMPVLKEEFGENISKVLSRVAETTAQDSDFLERSAQALYLRIVRRKTETVEFARPQFAKLHASMQFRMIQTGAHELGSEFAFDHWRELERLFADNQTFTSHLPNGVVCLVSKQKIILKPRGAQKSKKSPKEFLHYLQLGDKIRIRECRKTIECALISRKPHSLVKNREDYVLMDAARLHFPLEIRNRRESDRFKPLGQQREQKLKDFLIKHKVPHGKRDSIPLLVSNQKIIWVAGIALSDDTKITSASKRFVKFLLK